MPSVRKRSGEGCQNGAWSHIVASNGKAVISFGLPVSVGFVATTSVPSWKLRYVQQAPLHLPLRIIKEWPFNVGRHCRSSKAMEANRPEFQSHHCLDVCWWTSHFTPWSCSLTTEWE